VRFGLEIVAHEVEVGRYRALGRMDGDLCRREGEDWPTGASVYRRKAEDVTEEGAIGWRILALDDHMTTEDH
jgi:hypothetical protein